MKAKHDNKGNCLAAASKCSECGKGNHCDVCHEHESPRGECEECPRCVACDEKARKR